MRRRNRAGVFDRAPILLGACGHFAHICEQPVGVAAEGAVHFLDPVQVRQLMSIDREVPAARHTCNPVDRKADRLIERHPQIENDERKQQRVDDWSGQKAEEIAFSNICRDALAQPPMRLSKLLVKPHPAAVKPILPSPLLFLDLASEVLLGVKKPLNEAFHVRWHPTLLCVLW